MYLILLIVFFIALIAFYANNTKNNEINYINKKIKKENFQIYKKPCVKNITEKCYNDPLTLDKCWLTKEFPCPRYNGSYMQCTNNYKRDVNIANCLERTYYYSPKDERLSKKCVYKNVFPFAVKKNIPNPSNPSIFPRVNVWRNEDLPNGFMVNL